MRISDWSSDVCSSDLLCAAEGLSAFRGTETNWMYLPGNGAAQSLARRAARLADTYLPLSGRNAVEPCSGDPLMNVRSSRFLRPYKPGLKSLQEMRLSRIGRRSEGHTSELQSLMPISYAVFVFKNM